MLKPHLHCLLLLFPMITLAQTSQAERIAVPDIKPLLMRAAAHGQAHGTLSGTAAAYMQRRFDTSSPIEIDVRRLHALPKAGCARLEVRTGQRATLNQGQRQDPELVYSLSYCADGSFPKE